jgi:hypothetical protein
LGPTPSLKAASQIFSINRFIITVLELFAAPSISYVSSKKSNMRPFLGSVARYSTQLFFADVNVQLRSGFFGGSFISTLNGNAFIWESLAVLVQSCSETDIIVSFLK